MMPSVAANMAIVSPPIIDANVMFYYRSRVGGGMGIRNLSFLSAIVQLRFWENLSAGIAYSYPINAMRFTQQNSFEVMIGVVPMGMDSKATGKHSVAKCPGLSY